MRHVTHPVAVITATDTSVDAETPHRGWRGATVSSFNTVTLSPDPIVSFNIKKLSSTFEAIKSSGFFNVHFLSGRAQHARIVAARFAAGNAASPFHDAHGELEDFAASSEETKVSTGNEPPVLQVNSGDGRLMAPLRLHCCYMQDKLVEIGDHVVVFGQVIKLFHHTSSFEDGPGRTPILVYVNGAYHHSARPPMRSPVVKGAAERTDVRVSGGGS